MSTPKFGAYSRKEGYKTIYSPSQYPDYSKRFHEPMIEQLVRLFGAPIRLLDVACGAGDELVHISNDKRILITGVDISREMLAVARVNVPSGTFREADVCKDQPEANAFQGAIAVNAMISCPDKMLSYAYKALVGGGMAVVNFRDAGRAENTPFFHSCDDRGCLDYDITLEVNGKHFSLRVMDYTQRADKPKNLVKQVYFQNQQDIEDLLSLTGFEIVSHGTYTYESPENEHNVTDVYTLKRP